MFTWTMPMSMALMLALQDIIGPIEHSFHCTPSQKLNIIWGRAKNHNFRKQKSSRIHVSPALMDTAAMRVLLELWMREQLWDIHTLTLPYPEGQEKHTNLPKKFHTTTSYKTASTQIEIPTNFTRTCCRHSSAYLRFLSESFKVP